MRKPPNTIWASGAAAAALLGLAGAAAASPEDVAARLAAPGVWAYLDASGKVRPSGSFVGVPPDSVLTPEGRHKRQAFDFKADDPVLGCGEPGMPRALTAASPMTFSWRGDSLIVHYESMDVTRTVHMNERAVPADAPRTPNGYAVGHWDGDALVVETARLDLRVQDLQGTPKSDTTRLIERYRVEKHDGADVLRLDLTLIDKAVFTAPYDWHLDFVLKPEWSLMKYDCQERPAELTPGLEP